MIIFNVTTPYTKAFCKIVNVNSMLHKALEIEKSVTRINFLKSQLHFESIYKTHLMMCLRGWVFVIM